MQTYYVPAPSGAAYYAHAPAQYAYAPQQMMITTAPMDGMVPMGVPPGYEPM